MYLNISALNPSLLQAASTHFSEKYKKSLTGNIFFQESLVARFLISQYIGNQYLPEIDKRGIPQFQDTNFWSISHKIGLVFIAASQNPIGVDIEYLLEKSPELLDIFSLKFYEKIGEKNWKNFYILWTSFEALQKMECWENISVDEVGLLSIEYIKSEISDISFHTRTLYVCKGKTYQVFTGFDKNRVYSVCTSQNFDYEIIL